MIKLTPSEFHSILNAALFEIAKHPEGYIKGRPKARELYKWLISINWDNPEEESIMIDELPF